MGFWSTLGKIGKIAGAGVATAMTGGAAAPLLIGAVGNVLGSAAEGAAQGRQAEGQTALTQQQLALQAARDALNAPLLRGQAATRGSAMANMQDVKLNSNYQNPWAMQFSGGLRPSLLTPEARSLGTLMAQQALKGQQEDKGYAGIASQYPIPQAGFWEKAAGIGGLVGSLGGAIGGALQRSKEPYYNVDTYGPEDEATGLDTTQAVSAAPGFLSRQNLGPWFRTPPLGSGGR